MKMTPRGMHLAAGFAVLLLFISLFADFLSPNPPSLQKLDQFFSPPSRVRFFDSNSRLHFRPFIYRSVLTNPLEAEYREITYTTYPLEFFFKGYRYKLFGVISMERHLVGRSREPLCYFLGADELGRDVLARTLAGARTSLLVVVLGMAVYAALGITIGAFAGLLGGWVDSILMRFSELVLALPALYLVLFLRALLPMRVPFWQILFLTAGTIAGVTWPPMARGIRGMILQLRSAAFVEAARSLGGTPTHILFRHLLPQLLPFALTQTVIAAPLFLLGEVVLSFLNVGFRDSGESWGAMLRSLRDTRVLTDYWWNLLPLCMVFLTLLCLNAISSRLRRMEPGDQVMRMG